MGHQREGFIWQKLREPRSYDYKKTQNKSYNERLRMPQFTAFDDTPARGGHHVRAGPGRRAAGGAIRLQGARRGARPSSKGWQVIEKFNCTGCHTLQHGALEAGL